MNIHKSTSVVIRWHNKISFLYRHKMKILANILYRIMQVLFGCTIPPQVILEKGVNIPHFHGIVIHPDTKIGSGTLIYQNVTLGGRNGQVGINVGRNCIIGAGACVLGKITIGDNVKIGANSVVLTDVPDNCTVVGVPGKIVN